MATASLKHRFSSDQFLRMAEAGILPPDARIELLDGEIVPMSPIGPRHSASTKLLLRALLAHLTDGWHMGIQDPVDLDSCSQPQPDISIIRGKPEDYSQHHPTAADIGLLIEVADSSLELDTGVKRALYAASGIPEYWVVDLINCIIEQSTLPGPGGYGSTEIHGMLDSVTATVVNGLSVQVSAIFPQER
jgi:Uma2 family endonuclease